MQFAQGKNILKKNGKNEFLEPPYNYFQYLLTKNSRIFLFFLSLKYLI